MIFSVTFALRLIILDNRWKYKENGAGEGIRTLDINLGKVNV